MKRAATLRAGVAIRTPLVRGRWRREEFCVTMQMLEKQIAMAELIGRPIATPEQARQMLKIGVMYETTAETLENLGLPPNRVEGNMGFQVHETDGQFRPAAQGGCGHIHAGDWEEGVGGVQFSEPLIKV